jgi:hypothetical protein
MTETEKKIQEYLAEIGRRGGLASRRELTRSHAKKMVAIREAKRALPALKNLAVSEVEWADDIFRFIKAFSRCEPLRRLLDLRREISRHN